MFSPFSPRAMEGGPGAVGSPCPRPWVHGGRAKGPWGGRLVFCSVDQRTVTDGGEQSPSCSSAPFLPFSLSPFLPFSLSPFLPFSLSPFLPFSLSPFLPFSLSPFLPFSLSPFLPFSLSPLLACFFHLHPSSTGGCGPAWPLNAYLLRSSGENGETEPTITKGLLWFQKKCKGVLLLVI